MLNNQTNVIVIKSAWKTLCSTRNYMIFNRLERKIDSYVAVIYWR